MEFRYAGRAPKCTRCRNHGVINDLRGHKHKCVFRDCACDKCLISSDKQRATADRIALFRQQVRELQQSERLSKMKNEIHVDSENGCRKQFTQENFTPKFNQFTGQTNPQHSCHSNSHDSNKTDLHTKNIEVLKYIFPFYDEHTLHMMCQTFHGDILQTVLSISSVITQDKNKCFSYGHSSRPPTPTTSLPDGYCNHWYCPVNSYTAVKRRYSDNDGVTIQQQRHVMQQNNFKDDYSVEKFHKTKRQRHEHKSITEIINLSPYCGACKRLGSFGDTLCSRCGLAYNE